MVKTKKERKAQIKACDKLWSTAIKLKAKGFCELTQCPKPGIDAHHVYSRKYKNTRWDVQNGIFLCKWHHIYFAQVEIEKFRDIIIRKMGQRQYDRLKVRAYAPKYIDMEMSKIELQEYIKQMEAT